MGVRFESKALLNWTNEMAKFMRLITDEQHVFHEPLPVVFDQVYVEFFKNGRDHFLKITGAELIQYAKAELDVEQIRPLALVLMHDGLKSGPGSLQVDLLSKSKVLLNYVMNETSSFAFEDYAYLGRIAQILKEGD